MNNGKPVPKGEPTGLYRLRSGKHARIVKGVQRIFRKGDELELTEEELRLFGDKFEPVFRPTGKTKAAPTATSAEAIVALKTVEQVVEALKATDDDVLLVAVDAVERNQQKPRKGVLDYIASRMKVEA